MPYPLPFVNTYFADSRPIPPFCGKYTKSRDDPGKKEERIAPPPQVKSILVVLALRRRGDAHAGFLLKTLGQNFCRKIG